MVVSQQGLGVTICVPSLWCKIIYTVDFTEIPICKTAFTKNFTKKYDSKWVWNGSSNATAHMKEWRAPQQDQAGCIEGWAWNTAWMTLAELSQTGSVPPEGKTSSAAQINLPPGLRLQHMHGPELQGKDIQGGVIREKAVE